MKRKRSTRFTPIKKVDPVGCMVAGDRRKMIEAHQQAMAQDAAMRAELLDMCRESIQMLRAMSGQAVQCPADGSVSPAIYGDGSGQALPEIAG